VLLAQSCAGAWQMCWVLGESMLSCAYFCDAFSNSLPGAELLVLLI
jgi:hypothetical protein